ncbi:MAG: hypothetical protein F6K09_13315, partial [Merismopedia sp. SIO2A8]|nr:hypothetical protein [Merismopedia sp. SIO2A8]
AGNIKINVEGDINVIGTDTGIFASTEEGSTGDGGNINIDPRLVRIEDGASISANSLGTGEGGDITLESGRLFLVNGLISAQTNTARGGNITLTIGDLLLLSENSSISATAGEAQGAGDGGNIMINVADGYVIALDQSNNDIVANAFAGNGGEIIINANQIINLAPRLSQPDNQTNDIDASSEFGSSGTITINGINVDPTRGLAALPTQIVDAARLVAQECAAGAIAQNQSEFTITGQGGLIPEPGNSLSQAIWEDTRVPLQLPVAVTPSDQRQPLIASPGANLGSNAAEIARVSPTQQGITPSAQPQALIPSNISGGSGHERSPFDSPNTHSQSIIPSAQPQALIPSNVSAIAPATHSPPITHSTAETYPIPETQAATTDNERVRAEAQGWLQDEAGNIMLLTELTAMMAPTAENWQPNPTCGMK